MTINLREYRGWTLKTWFLQGVGWLGFARKDQATLRPGWSFDRGTQTEEAYLEALRAEVDRAEEASQRADLVAALEGIRDELAKEPHPAIKDVVRGMSELLALERQLEELDQEMADLRNSKLDKLDNS